MINVKIQTEDKMIDILKLFFSLCILGIHTEVLSFLPEKNQWFIIHLIFRLGVPFFFVSSGFYLGKRLMSNKTSGIHTAFLYCKRLIPSYLFWSIIGGILQLIELVSGDVSLQEAIVIVIKYFFFYPMGGMWFVLASMIGSLIVCSAFDKKLFVYAGFFGFFGYLFAMSCNSYFWIFKDTMMANLINNYLSIFVSARNGLFVGIFMIWLGVFSYKLYTDVIIKKRELVLAGILSYTLLFFEIFMCYGKEVKDDSSLFMSFIILIPTLVLLAIKSQISYQMNYKNLRLFSKCIFYLHPPISLVLKHLLKNFVSGGIINFFITLFCCLVFYLIYKKFNLKIYNFLLP